MAHRVSYSAVKRASNERKWLSVRANRRRKDL